MKPIVFGFAGRIASGKSSISQMTADSLGLSRVSFGNYVRHVTTYLGLDASERTILQDVGNFLVKHPRSFCLKVLEQVDYQPGAGLVIDGIRHKEIADDLRLLVAPASFVLVYVAADSQSIERRLREERRSTDDLHHLEQDATEVQVRETLADIADISVINNDSRSPDDVLEELLELLKLYT